MVTEVKIKPFREVSKSGEVRISLHSGQEAVHLSKARFVFMLGSPQVGKTCYGPIWLKEEIRRSGGGDYLAVTATYDLFKLKMLPEIMNTFVGGEGEDEKGDKVSVSGVSKGKGFQGVMKRYHYAGGPGSHGSMFNRAPGSIGQSSFPSRVWKNKGMPGHMGAERVTVKNLKIIDVNTDQNLLLILGAVPGAKGSFVEIRKEDWDAEA